MKRYRHSKNAGGSRKPQFSRNGRPNSNGGNGNQDRRVYANALKAIEKFTNMAKDAQSSGDIVQAEHYFQFADHYQRVANANVPPQQEPMRNEADDQDDQPAYYAGSNDSGEDDAPAPQERFERPERHDRPERGERQERQDRAERYEQPRSSETRPEQRSEQQRRAPGYRRDGQPFQRDRQSNHNASNDSERVRQPEATESTLPRDIGFLQAPVIRAPRQMEHISNTPPQPVAASHAVQSDHVSDSVVTDNVDEPVKRRRGRPRKTPLSETAPQAAE